MIKIIMKILGQHLEKIIEKRISISEAESASIFESDNILTQKGYIENL